MQSLMKQIIMQILGNQTKIDFIGLRKLACIVSLILLASGVYSLFNQGLNLGIDFTGGAQLSITLVTRVLKEGIGGHVPPDVGLCVG